MNSIDIIKQGYNLVWEFRQELVEVWPIPDELDSLRFAVTEVAEAEDALLRLNPRYKRNRDKDVNTNGELAQCAMMLLTALGEEFEWDRWSESQIGYCIESYDVARGNGYQGTRIDWIAGVVSAALQEALWQDEYNATYESLKALTQIVAEVDLVEGLRTELEKIKTKRLAVMVH